MTAANVALMNNATCSGPSAAPVPNSTIVKTIRPISTTTGASASSSDGSRGPGAGVRVSDDAGSADMAVLSSPGPHWAVPDRTRAPARLWPPDVPPRSISLAAGQPLPAGLDAGHERLVGESSGFLVRRTPHPLRVGGLLPTSLARLPG